MKRNVYQKRFGVFARLTQFVAMILLTISLSAFGVSANAQEVQEDWREELQQIRRAHPAPAHGFFLTVQGAEWLLNDVQRYSFQIQELELRSQELEITALRLRERTVVLQEEVDNYIEWNVELRLERDALVADLETVPRQRFWMGFGLGFAICLIPLVVVIVKQ